MEEKDGRLQTTRRGFLKTAGMGMLVAAGAGAFGLAGCAAEEPTGAQTSAAGIAKPNMDLYTDVFPVPTRNIPVLDVPTDMVRRGNVAFEVEVPESKISRTEETEVLVIGCGITGVCASLSASDDGKTKVLCIEKMDVGRGVFEGFGVVGGKAMKAGKNMVDPAEAADWMRHAADYRTPIDPTWLWANRSGEASDWLQKRFDEGEMGITQYYLEQPPNTHHYDSPQTEVSFASDNFSEAGRTNSGGIGLWVVRDLTNTLSKRENVDLRFKTPAVKLERGEGEGGRVTGAIAKDADGNYFRIKASKGVIMATGGYDANPDMMKAWCRPEDIANAASWCPTLGTTGDGHLMGLQIGGQVDPLPHAVMNFNWGGPDAFWSDPFHVWGPLMTGIMVNEKGLRFSDENLPMQLSSNAISAQKGYGANCWTVFDGGHFDDVWTSKADIDPWVEKGVIKKAKTVKELAEQMNVDPEGLAYTIERYNGFIKKGKDEDFLRDAPTMVPIDEKNTLYAMPHQSSILATVSGLVVNRNCEVLDYENEVIPGLYAAGNASGGMFAGNYPRHIFGPSIGRCITFGYVAGQNAAKA